MPEFTPCTLKMGQDGDPSEFFPKVTGFGYNDMISLPTLTKDSILENLKRRFKVRPTPRGSTTGARLRSLQRDAHHAIRIWRLCVHTGGLRAAAQVCARPCDHAASELPWRRTSDHTRPTTLREASPPPSHRPRTRRSRSLIPRLSY